MKFKSEDPTAGFAPELNRLFAVAEKTEWALGAGNLRGKLIKIQPEFDTPEACDLEFETNAGQTVTVPLTKLSAASQHELFQCLDSLFVCSALAFQESSGERIMNDPDSLPFTSWRRTVIASTLMAEIDEETGLNRQVATSDRDRSRVARENARITGKQVEFYRDRRQLERMMSMNLLLYTLDVLRKYEERTGNLSTDDIRAIVKQLLEEDEAYVAYCQMGAFFMLQGLNGD